MKVDLQEQHNSDRNYLFNTLKARFQIVEISSNLVTIEYKGQEFCVIYLEGTFPLFCMFTENENNYPHFIRHKNITVGDKELIVLCLFIKEEIVEYSMKYSEKVEFVLGQFESLINLSPVEQIREIMKEFKYHFNKSVTIYFESMVPVNFNPHMNIKIYCYHNNGSEDYVVSSNNPFERKKSCTQSNCVYIDVLDMRGILPPSYVCWDGKYLSDIFFSLNRNRFSESIEKKLRKLKVKEKVIIVLRFKELFGYEIGIKVSFSEEKQNFFKKKLNCIKKIEFININNATIENSMLRNGQMPIKQNKVLIIGAGSLGSYIVSELPKVGIKNISIVDYENLTYENVSRHKLGDYWVGENKAKSLSTYLEVNNKHIKADCINKRLDKENISDILHENHGYDLIIVTTGSEDLQSMINRHNLSLQNFTPIIYCWLEASSIGAHVLVMKDAESGCYNCLRGKAYRYICEVNQVIKYNGCGGTYTQYGTSILLETTGMLMKIISTFDSLKHNQLYSYKSNMLSENNLKMTSTYNVAKYGVNVITDLKDGECIECNKI